MIYIYIFFEPNVRWKNDLPTYGLLLPTLYEAHAAWDNLIPLKMAPILNPFP